MPPPHVVDLSGEEDGDGGMTDSKDDPEGQVGVHLATRNNIKVI